MLASEAGNTTRRDPYGWLADCPVGSFANCACGTQLEILLRDGRWTRCASGRLPEYLPDCRNFGQ